MYLRYTMTHACLKVPMKNAPVLSCLTYAMLLPTTHSFLLAKEHHHSVFVIQPSPPSSPWILDTSLFTSPTRTIYLWYVSFSVVDFCCCTLARILSGI
ncbi:hypothetical protein B0H66DRAFT_566630 [Apodospora peruviana]|uniref:Uncharacterized protein n=1 Tax=Apodospora peruviana TaxID=516989 RepID=A0AAE0HVE6_9PEZI|nr:hypothetical protein B0H66DRAFT_566630 [Apodospora peruviana]